MAILAAMGNNLRFQTPDLQPGINNMTMGLQTLAGMAKDHRLDRERDSFLAAMDLADTSTPEGRKLADMANIQARAFGVDTGGYDSAMNRDMQREKMAAEQERLNHWSNNPEYIALNNMANKYIQDKHAADTQINMLISRNIPETDPLYINAVSKFNTAENGLQGINSRYNELNVPESVRWLGIQDTKPENNTQAANSSLSEIPYYQDYKKKQEIVNQLLTNFNKQNITPESIGAWLVDNGYAVTSDLAGKTIHNAYNNALEAAAANEKREYERKMREVALEAARLGLVPDRAQAAKIKADVKSQHDFLKGDTSFNETNVIRAATLFPAFKEDIGIEGNSVGSILTSAIKKAMNNNDLRIKYETFINARKNELPPPQPPNKRKVEGDA